MINGRTRLHVVANGTMTGQRYIDEVLFPHVRLFRGAVGDKFVFIDDNATCHRKLAVQDCLDSEGIQRLVLPARSPDVNPIENVWDALGRQVAGRNYPPTNKNTLIHVLTEEWDKLPLNSCWIMLCKGLGSNPGEGMDVCKCMVSLRHGDTLNSRRAASLVRLVEGEERWEVLTTPKGKTYQNSSTRLPHKSFDFDSGELENHVNERPTGELENHVNERPTGELENHVSERPTGS
ncbi:transposable element Tc1 transposase [Trichonephila clavipes]|nr:transposable element Tc1 transposase [Trichonephila clavipes]